MYYLLNLSHFFLMTQNRSLYQKILRIATKKTPFFFGKGVFEFYSRNYALRPAVGNYPKRKKKCETSKEGYFTWSRLWKFLRRNYYLWRSHHCRCYRRECHTFKMSLLWSFLSAGAYFVVDYWKFHKSNISSLRIRFIKCIGSSEIAHESGWFFQYQENIPVFRFL